MKKGKLSYFQAMKLSKADKENLLTHLQHYFLGLDMGFALVGRQHRILLNYKYYRVDLVFYHRILKCFVLIDLKKDGSDCGDLGKMEMYLGYFEEKESTAGDNPPIGILLAKEKKEWVVYYAMKHVNSQLYVQKYQLHLPEREELQRKLEEILQQNKDTI